MSEEAGQTTTVAFPERETLTGKENMDGGFTIEASMGQLKEVLEGHFFSKVRQPSNRPGYCDVYEFEIHLLSTICARPGMPVQLIKPFRFGLYLPNSPRGKPMIATTPDGPVPFHPQFWTQHFRGSEVGVWKDPLEHVRGELVTDIISRLVLTLVYVEDLMDPPAYHSPNPRAWKWYLENKSNCPTDIPNFRWEKVEKLGRPDWVPEKIEKPAGQEQKAAEPAPLQPVTVQKPSDLERFEKKYEIPTVVWPKTISIEKWSRQHPSLAENSPTLYLTGRAFSCFQNNANVGMVVAKQACFCGLIQGHALYKDCGGEAGWATRVYPLKGELLLDRNCIQSGLNRSYPELVHGLSDESTLLGWYAAFKGGFGDAVPALIAELHRQNFNKPWQFLLLCDQDSGDWWVYRGSGLALARGCALRETDPQLPPIKKKPFFSSIIPFKKKKNPHMTIRRQR